MEQRALDGPFVFCYNSTMDKQQYYEDFLAISKMHSPINKKVRMLTELLGSYEDCWRVVGITKNALDVFANHNFKKVSKMGINRSHLVDRHKTYTFMLTNSFKNAEQWWDYFITNDKTILATSSENISKNLSEVYNIDVALGLFKTKGFAWSHTRQEQQFLKNLYECSK